MFSLHDTHDLVLIVVLIIVMNRRSLQRLVDGCRNAATERSFANLARKCSAFILCRDLFHDHVVNWSEPCPFLVPRTSHESASNNPLCTSLFGNQSFGCTDRKTDKIAWQPSTPDDPRKSLDPPTVTVSSSYTHNVLVGEASISFKKTDADPVAPCSSMAEPRPMKNQFAKAQLEEHWQQMCARLSKRYVFLKLVSGSEKSSKNNLQTSP